MILIVIYCLIFKEIEFRLDMVVGFFLGEYSVLVVLGVIRFEDVVVFVVRWG